MKNILVGLVAIIVMFSATSCEKPTNEEAYYKAQKHFNNLNSYKCTVDIVIKEEGGNNNYKAKHVYKKPEKYLTEVLEPQESLGIKTIFNGCNTWLYHPKIDQSILVKNSKGFLDKNMFLGYFLKISLTSEYIKLDSEVLDNREYIVVSVEIPGNNVYRKSEKIWIDKNNFTPYKLLVFNSDGEATIEVFYSNFEYNANIRDEIFSLDI